MEFFLLLLLNMYKLLQVNQNGSRMNGGKSMIMVLIFQSDHVATPTSRRQQDNPLFNNWRTALRCKQNVGTQEWINCKQSPCVHLRGELHHLLECRYRHIGGCKNRCIHLREELQKFRELLPKYPTITDEQLQARFVHFSCSCISCTLSCWRVNTSIN